MSNKPTQKATAEQFLKLHQGPPIFVLANAWDVASARIFEMANFRAVGTTSYALAANQGLHDGQHIPLQDTVDLVSRLVEKINLPISADIEAGYAETVEGVVESARRVLKAGAVGINLEDSSKNSRQPLYDIGFQQEKIRAIRLMADAEGVHLVINARTDTFFVPGDNPGIRLSQTITRGNAYREAGADCVFVPDMGELDPATMKILVREIGGQINIIAGGTTPSLAQLEDIGIARVSLGPRALRAVFGLLKRIAEEIRDQGTFTQMNRDAFSVDEIRRMFTDPKA